MFAGHYIKEVISSVKETHPDLPIILYISGSGGILERMAACGPDVVSLDYTVDMADSIQRIGKEMGYQVNGKLCLESNFFPFFSYSYPWRTWTRHSVFLDLIRWKEDYCLACTL